MPLIISESLTLLYSISNQPHYYVTNPPHYIASILATTQRTLFSFSYSALQYICSYVEVRNKRPHCHNQ